MIKHPSHYCDGRKYEPVKVIADWNLNFNLGNAVKYISRAGRKDNTLEDLYKAQRYLTFEIRRLEGKDMTADDEPKPVMVDDTGKAVQW